VVVEVVAFGLLSEIEQIEHVDEEVVVHPVIVQEVLAE